MQVQKQGHCSPSCGLMDLPQVMQTVLDHLLLILAGHQDLIFKDGKVSVEEAFYYARCVLRSDNQPNDYKKMEPQINDQYPKRGPIRSLKGLILGE